MVSKMDYCMKHEGWAMSSIGVKRLLTPQYYRRLEQYIDTIKHSKYSEEYKLLEFMTERDLNEYLRRFRTLSHDEIIKVLAAYAGAKVLEYLKDRYAEFLRDLAALVTWIDERYKEYYGLPELGVFVDYDTEEPMFIVIILHNCNKEEWGEIVNEIKEEMSKNGLDELRRRVAILCRKGFAESKI